MALHAIPGARRAWWRKLVLSFLTAFNMVLPTAMLISAIAATAWMERWLS